MEVDGKGEKERRGNGKENDEGGKEGRESKEKDRRKGRREERRGNKEQNKAVKGVREEATGRGVNWVPALRPTLLKGPNHRGTWEGGVGGLRA